MSDRAVGDLQRILEESEHRRTMLMEKLREAQDTIQVFFYYFSSLSLNIPKINK